MSAHTPGPVEKVGQCGCYAIERDENKPFTIFFCRLHAAAPALQKQVDEQAKEIERLQAPHFNEVTVQVETWASDHLPTICREILNLMPDETSSQRIVRDKARAILYDMEG